MGYENPLLKLPAARKLIALPAEQRACLELLLRELRADADRLAEQSWRKRKAPMAAYWRAVATYARHIAHVLSRGGARMEAAAGNPPGERAPAGVSSCVAEVMAQVGWLEACVFASGGDPAHPDVVAARAKVRASLASLERRDPVA